MKPLVVVKYGGNAMKSLELRRAVATEIAGLRQTHNVVVVHGGGPVIERDLARLNIESHFLRGLRVTTPEAMEVIEKALTLLCKELSQDIGKAIGLTGRDSSLLVGEALEPEFGRVGKVVAVNTELVLQLLESGMTPVIGCVATDAAGQPLNINADWAAGAVAGKLEAQVVFLTDVAGVMKDFHDPQSLHHRLSRTEALEWIQSGIIAGGMIPKVEAALNALDMGAPKATIASGMQAGVLLQALNGMAGTTLSNQIRLL
ncbi:MAG: acetylglutamate kinase [Deinococcales bacterium]